MVKLVSIVTLLCIISLIWAENPGVVAVIKKPILEKAKEKYFQSVFDTIGKQEIPDFQQGDIKVTNIRVSIENDDPSNVKLNFLQYLKQFSIFTTNSKLAIKVNWKYTKLLVDVSGSADIEGIFHSFGIDLTMRKSGNEGLYVPQIRVENFNMVLDEKDFDVKVHWSGCIGPIEATVTALLESSLFGQVKREIKKQIPLQTQIIGNQMLYDLYPKFFDLYENIGIATALTSEVIIEENSFVIPIDGTVYPYSEEFTRPEHTEEMPSYDPEDTGDIILLFNPYIVDTLSKTLNSQIFSYTGRTLGIGYKATLNPSRGETSFNFEEGDFQLEVHPRIVTKLLHWGVEFRAKMKLDPQIHQGDKNNMMTILPQVKKLSLRSLRLVIFGVPLPINLPTLWINIILKISLNWLLIPAIEIPKQDALPLHVTNSILDFHKDRTEFGIILDFNK